MIKGYIIYYYTYIKKILLEKKKRLEERIKYIRGIPQRKGWILYRWLYLRKGDVYVNILIYKFIYNKIFINNWIFS